MIRVFHGYLVDVGKHIPSDVYDETDPRLYGMAEYLVKNRHAEVVEGRVDPTAGETVYSADWYYERLAEVGEDPRKELAALNRKIARLEKKLGGAAEKADESDETPAES